jgi:hypothetical protein
MLLRKDDAGDVPVGRSRRDASDEERWDGHGDRAQYVTLILASLREGVLPLRSTLHYNVNLARPTVY